jgi:calcium-dependent protein kinase
MHANILKGEEEFNGRMWETISDDAKDLVGKMLECNPIDRITAKEALEHPWFSNRSVAVKKQKELTEIYKQNINNYKVNYVIVYLCIECVHLELCFCECNFTEIRN